MPRYRLHVSILAASAFLTLSGSSRGQSVSGYAIDRFDPSDRGSRWFTLESLDFAGAARPAAGVVGEFNDRPIHLYDAQGVSHDVVDNQLVFHVGASLAFLERFRVGLSLPLYAEQSGQTLVADDGNTYPGASGGGVGDLRVSADARVLGGPHDVFRLGLGVRVWAPTGQQSNYTGDGSASVAGILDAAGDLGPLVYAARVGYRYRGLKETYGPTHVGDEIPFGVSAGFKLAGDAFVLGPELQGSVAVSSTTSANGSSVTYAQNEVPLYGLLGAHYTAGDVRVGAGAGPGLSTATGTSLFRAVASIEWAPAATQVVERPADRDHDGVVDLSDACPDTPGVANENPARNGCPPPPDRDRDGVVDLADACPDTPGVVTEDPKTTGCPAPPPDRDGDGIADITDACPETKGIAAPDPKLNGCPPPDPDRDKDSVPNPDDACPDEAGPSDPDPKKNGCPRAVIKGEQIVVTDQVKFATGSAQIIAGADNDRVLDAVGKVLADHAAVRLRVEGYTDNQGADAANRKLSAARAASVVAWLVHHGIEAKRLEAKGLGPDKPIADNATTEGRQANRRVEFHVLPP